MIVIERLFDGTRDVGAAASSPDTPVELAHEIVPESYVHSYGHRLTHT